METKTLFISSSSIKTVLQCLADAIGDDILADICENDLQTRNSVSSRIWDLFNRNLIKAINKDDFIIIPSNRGPWEMLILYHKPSQNIFTFMREKRFTELQKRQKNRKRMHYVDMLAKQFNKDLLPINQQICLFSHSFSDDDKLEILVEKLLHAFNSDTNIINNHVLVLFSTSNYQLMSVRAVMVTPTLDIARGSEQDWSQYIPNNESIIVEKVDQPKTPENQPNRGLTLKTKAITRKNKKLKLKSSDNSSTQTS